MLISQDIYDAACSTQMRGPYRKKQSLSGIKREGNAVGPKRVSRVKKCVCNCGELPPLNAGSHQFVNAFRAPFHPHTMRLQEFFLECRNEEKVSSAHESEPDIEAR